ncbi:OLC1v1000601C1 [Oldenlandia corymbosa var. corymbosa]|uniref:OLC1v1000601C1 n=1 Tax=Oldenlandia corymbosa var. corymbosa TaxID=529605 RepID=A0AAV1D5H2_OLDCO|nr:OLC1v1000601C1 [Oldenlandia corymbosa var. corymbosa]
MDEEGLLQNGDDVVQNCMTTSSSTKVTLAVVFSSLVALSGSFANGCANGFSSPAESGIIHDLGLSTAQYAFFGSLSLFGSMLGAILSGKVTDFMGRRGALWFTLIFFMIGWLAIVLAKDVWWLDSGRFLQGFSGGVQGYASIIYVAEIIPKSIRGAFTMASQLMVCGGITVMFSVGNVLPWRTLALIGTIPCIIQFIGLLFIPESPRWLAKVGRHEEVESSLQWLRGKDTDVSQEAAEILNCTQSSDKLSIFRFKELLDKRYADPLIVGVGLPFLLPWAGTNGILLYANSVSDAAGCGPGIVTTTMAFIQIPFSVLGVLLMDKFGRKPLLIIDLAGVCLGGILIGVGFLLQNLQLWTNETPTIVFIGIQIYFSFFAFGAGLPFVIISEIFPMNIKSSAGSIAAFANSFNSWIVAYVFSFLFDWSSAGTFFIFSSICAMLMVFVVKKLPETKGRSLEEIEASWITQEVY